MRKIFLLHSGAGVLSTKGCMLFQSFVRLKSKCLRALCTHDFVIVAPPEALIRCMTLIAILLIGDSCLLTHNSE